MGASTLMSVSQTSELASKHSWLTKDILASLIESIGTPVFAYSEERLLKNGRRIHNALQSSGIHNPVKIFAPFFPNSNPYLFQPLQKIGIGALIQLPTEHTILSRFGINNFIVSTGYLPSAEIETWARIGCPTFLSSIDEVEYLIRNHPDMPIYVRFDCLTSDKPGVKYAQLSKLRNLLESYDRQLDGFELYCGSSNSASDMAGYLEQVFMIHKTHFPNAKAIDFAGGYSFDYETLDQEKKHFEWDRYFRSLKDAVERYSVSKSVEFWFEPARDLFADMGVLILSVKRLVMQPGSNQLLIDGSRVLMPSAKMKDRAHNVLFFDENLKELPPGMNRAMLRGRGILRHDQILPGEYRIPDTVKAGDTAIILDVGAYCATQHMEFLNIPSAPEVMIGSSGESTLITKRAHELDKWRNLVDVRRAS
jgi:diaminopimelate decarboxylase